MTKNVLFSIDFVITWVNQDDPKWRKKYSKYAGLNDDEETDIRFRDYGTLKYVFRSIDRYAPWVHKVFLITDHQVPDWLDNNYSKLVVINHDDYIDSQYLPTFNSNVIDLNLFNINQLSEHFVYFNDDMFINKPTRPEDFFDIKGNPRDILGLNAIMPTGIFDHIYINNLSVVNHIFSKRKQVKKLFWKFFRFSNAEWNFFTFLLMPWPKFTRFFDPHIQLSFKKSTIKNVLEKYPEVLQQTGMNKFRSTNDYSIWLFRYVQMLSGDFSPRSAHFGKHYALNNWKVAVHDIERGKHTLININDASFEHEYEYTNAINNVAMAFNKKFPNKSKFELTK